MGHAEAVSAVWLVLVVAACVLLAWVGYRIEPHWVSKDGRRFMCNGQKLTLRGEALSRWHETRVTLNAAEQVQLDEKRFLGRTSTLWKVIARSETPPRGREVFVLKALDGDPAGLFAIRLPEKSRAVAALEAMISR
jgi:hypothetical protein